MSALQLLSENGAICIQKRKKKGKKWLGEKKDTGSSDLPKGKLE